MDPNASTATAAEMPLASKYGTLAGGTREKIGGPRVIPRTSAAARYAYYVLLLLPFALFFTAAYALAFVYFARPVEARALVCGCAVVPLWYILKTRRADSAQEAHHSQLLATTNGMALLAGAVFGYLIYSSFFFVYFATMAAQTYNNVTPRQVGGGLADAGRITFAADTWVDASRSVGFTARGHEYCVAPVIDSATIAEVQYWAIGEDCCDPRGGFKCGAIKGEEGKQKPTVVELFPAQSFHDAVELCVAENDLISADGAVYVRFVANADAALGRMWTNGLVLFIFGALFALAVSIIGSKMLQSVL